MALLSGQVKVPVIGAMPKAAVVIGVGGVIVLIIVEKRKQSAAVPAAAGDSTDGMDSTSADGTLPLQAAGDPYPWDGTYGTPGDPYSMDTGTGITYGDEGGGGGGTGQPSGPPFSTNAQWSQYVLAYFSENQFGDLAGMTTAIGLYLAGQPVDAAQAGYIHDATAIGGSPPVAGAGNFPPSIRQAGGHGGTVTVPDVIGVNVEQATQVLTSAGLKASGPAGVKGVVHVVTKQSPGSGSHVQKGTTVKLTTRNVTETQPQPVTPSRHQIFQAR